MMLFNFLLLLVAGYVAFLVIKKLSTAASEKEATYATKEDIAELTQKMEAFQRILEQKTAIDDKTDQP